MEEKAVLSRIVDILKEELTDALTGVYLHGSMALGCFHPQQSDIDILVVCREKRSSETYRRIADQLIRIEDEMHLAKGFEISIVLESAVTSGQYPTPFEFHYSAYHREKYRNDPAYLCGGDEDPDVVAHMAVIYDRGIVLYGKPIKELFQPANREHVIHSIASDASSALEEIGDNPVYNVLTLSRVLLYIQESVIYSKREAGQRALSEALPEHQELVSQCLAKYNGERESVNMDHARLRDYAEYMLRQIHQAMQA
ncbi:aminoglycoside adenylyltransferase domain-containing protein [Paenibacillus sp. 2TAF8]|jgi:streptomycin 3"-adenylyltransferase|uniref:aminoglycoside adenylyltransferase domain-containing protein n=1 Tax=Paenibacillus sp. 2TAF8 TaxID=3233020 RepID=UPI003F9D5B07